MKGILRNVLRQNTTRKDGALSAASHSCPGHHKRMASHMQKVRTILCECGSGRPYCECCLGQRLHTRDTSIYVLPDTIHPNARTRHAIEDRLHVRAFYTFYNTARDERDLVARFVRAVIASAATPDNDAAIAQWVRKYGRRRARAVVAVVNNSKGRPYDDASTM